MDNKPCTTLDEMIKHDRPGRVHKHIIKTYQLVYFYSVRRRIYIMIYYNMHSDKIIHTATRFQYDLLSRDNM
jgi:hypothetical protein